LTAPHIIMDPRAAVPLVPLHLTSLAILSPSNQPIFVHSFTAKSDELRHYHLSHAAVDVIEERSKPFLVKYVVSITED
jgi:hypothetical protein